MNNENHIKSQVYILTGNIASGKTAVSKFFKDLGAYIICADQLVADLYRDSTVISKVSKMLDIKDSKQDFKGQVRDKIFNSKELKSKLENYLHPLVREEFHKKAKKSLQDNKIVIYEVPLYYENKMSGFKDVIVVSSPDEIRHQRLMTNRGLDKNIAQKIMDSQIPQDVKIASADYVIENSGDLRELEDEVKSLWLTINKS